MWLLSCPDLLQLEVEAKRPENFVEKLQGKLPVLALLASADDGTVGHDVGLHECTRRPKTTPGETVSLPS